MELQCPQILIVVHSCNRTVGCNRTETTANHIHCTQLNSPITEFIKMTVATTTYPTKLEFSKTDEFVT